MWIAVLMLVSAQCSHCFALATGPLNLPTRVMVGVPAAGLQAVDVAQVAQLTLRRTAWSRCFIEWVSSVCQPSEAQSMQIRAAVNRAVEVDIARLTRQKGVLPHKVTLSDELPLRFTDVQGFAGSRREFILAEIMPLLDPHQRVLLQHAVDDQVAFQHARFVSYAVSIIDRELFLTEQQRQQLQERILAGKPLRHGLFRFSTSGSPLPCRPISTLLSRGDDLLTERQREHLEAMHVFQGRWSGRFQPQSVMFLKSRSGHWDDQIVQVLETQQRGCELLFSLRIDGLQIRHQLTPDQLRRLTLASKGATSELLSQWQMKAEDQLEKILQEFGDDPRWSGHSINCEIVPGADSHPIWQHAVNAILAEGTELNPTHSVAQRSAIANLILAVFDQELSLTNQQRGPCWELIAFSLPDDLQMTGEQESVQEMVFIAWALFSPSEINWSGVLTNSQLEALKAMRQTFEIRNGQFGIPLGTRHVPIASSR